MVEGDQTKRTTTPKERELIWKRADEVGFAQAAQIFQRKFNVSTTSIRNRRKHQMTHTAVTEQPDQLEMHEAVQGKTLQSNPASEDLLPTDFRCDDADN